MKEGLKPGRDNDRHHDQNREQRGAGSSMSTTHRAKEQQHSGAGYCCNQ
jgi:hypothetical protein